MKFFIGDVLGYLSWVIGFKKNSGLVWLGCEMAVKTVLGYVEFTADKPFDFGFEKSKSRVCFQGDFH
jgi:hypothetical protein